MAAGAAFSKSALEKKNNRKKAQRYLNKYLG